MPLAPGTRIGPYEILGPIGAGGLGQMVVVPQGTGQLDLRYEPGWTTRIISLIGLLLTALWAWFLRW
jgi:hypothetical protein